MCAIAGILRSQPADLSVLSTMLARMVHRGPDQGGALYYTPGGALAPQVAADIPQGANLLALGHRRLSILDVSEAGRQPMQSADGRYWISYNGEVYNYQEMRLVLETKGHRFRTHTDTEVILAAFAEEGSACFSRFVGMWALAILDTHAQTLTLSRDRFGIKPLYLYRRADQLAFASEIKALLPLMQGAPSLHLPAAQHFMAQQWLGGDAGCFFAGIEEFPPAHSATFALGDASFHLAPTPYWQYPTDTLNLTPTEAAREFQRLFHQAIDQHLRSDVAVGACLSGGLDSSAITAFAAARMAGMHSFTSVFRGKGLDESLYAEAVVEQTGVTAHRIHPTADGLMADLDALLWHQEEPFYSTSIYAQWCVMRAAREAGVPVLLDGQGADEIFCGYKKYYPFYLIELARKKQASACLREATTYLRHGDRNRLNMAHVARYLPAFIRRDLHLLSQLTPALASAPSAPLGAGRSIQHRQITDLAQTSLPSLLRYEDRNSMAFSVESRVPFLDHRLVEFGLRLPSALKLKHGFGKWVMREALEGAIPESVRLRRDKMGFVAPMRGWVQSHILPTFQSDINSGMLAIAPLVETDRLRAHVKDPSAAIANDTASGTVLRLFLLNRWAIRFGVTLAA